MNEKPVNTIRCFLLWLNGKLVRCEWGVACLAIVAGLGVSLYTVSARALRVPTAEWVLELPMELLVIAAIYGSGALVGEDKHLSVSFVMATLPVRIRRVVQPVVRIMLAAFCLFLAQRGLTATTETLRLDLRIPELFNISSAVPIAIASLGITLWGLHHLLSLLKPLTEDDSGYTVPHESLSSPNTGPKG